MDGARIRTASRRVTSRAERRTILRGRLLGMQTSYRARILANPRFFVHRLSRLAVSIPLFPIHVSNCRPVSLTLAPLTSSLSRFLASSSEFCEPPSGVPTPPPLLAKPPLHLYPCARIRCIGRAHALYALLTFYHPRQENHPLSPFSPSPSASSLRLLLFVFFSNPPWSSSCATRSYLYNAFSFRDTFFFLTLNAVQAVYMRKCICKL